MVFGEIRSRKGQDHRQKLTESDIVINNTTSIVVAGEVDCKQRNGLVSSSPRSGTSANSLTHLVPLPPAPAAPAPLAVAVPPAPLAVAVPPPPPWPLQDKMRESVKQRPAQTKNSERTCICTSVPGCASASGCATGCACAATSSMATAGQKRSSNALPKPKTQSALAFAQAYLAAPPPPAAPVPPPPPWPLQDKMRESVKQRPAQTKTCASVPGCASACCATSSMATAGQDERVSQATNALPKPKTQSALAFAQAYLAAPPLAAPLAVAVPAPPPPPWPPLQDKRYSVKQRPAQTNLHLHKRTWLRLRLLRRLRTAARLRPSS
jgi:hypothetical protein